MILELELLKILTLDHEELMVDCLKDSKPFMDVDTKHGCDELDEALEITMPSRVVQIDLASDDGFDKCAVLVPIKGRLAKYKDEQDHSNGPDVSLCHLILILDVDLTLNSLR